MWRLESTIDRALISLCGYYLSLHYILKVLFHMVSFMHPCLHCSRKSFEESFTESTAKLQSCLRSAVLLTLNTQRFGCLSELSTTVALMPSCVLTEMKSNREDKQCVTTTPLSLVSDKGVHTGERMNTVTM